MSAERSTASGRELDSEHKVDGERSDLSSGGEGVPELSVSSWHARDEQVGAASFGVMAGGLPRLVVQAVRWAFAASPRDAVAAVAFTVAAGVFTAAGLFATTNVLGPLFSEGPTPDRVWAALPALVLVGAAMAVRALLSAVSGWAQARLEPCVNELVCRRMFEQTTLVELRAYDDPGFYETLQRARDRGLMEAPRMVTGVADIATGVAGLLAAGSVLAVLHPLLLGLLVLAVIPEGWAVFKTANQRYSMWRELNKTLRRRHVLSEMMADRDSAGEVRSFAMRAFLLGEYDATSAREINAYHQLARRQALTRIAGDAASGLATGLVYVLLGWMLLADVTPLAIAGTAVLAIQTGQRNLTGILYSLNATYEAGLYLADVLEFHTEARNWITQPAGNQANSDQDDTPSHTAQRGQLHAPILHGPMGHGPVTVDRVSFTYPGETTPALSEVSLTIGRGETVAFVGENGSGKTTLAKLLAGLYLPDAGAIAWDGTDLSAADREDWRARVAVIAQAYCRWPATARLNVTMTPGLDHERFDNAVRVSGAAEVVDALPDGMGFPAGQEIHRRP